MQGTIKNAKRPDTLNFAFFILHFSLPQHHIQRLPDFVHADELYPLNRIEFREVTMGQDASTKPHLCRFPYTQFSLTNSPYFSAKSHLAQYDGAMIDGTLTETRGDRGHNPQVNRRLIDLHATDDIHIHILSGQMQTQAFLHNGEEQ